VAHAVWAAARGGFHWENVVILAFVFATFGIGPRSQKLFVGFYPIGLVGLLYDTMRLVANVGVSPRTVHLCDLRAHELALFGVTMSGQRVTYHDWLQAHPSPVLDLLCAIPYGTFLFVCMGCAIWLYFRDYRRMLRYAWSWLALSVAGFVTYHLYPAAPPWYFHAHGCQVDMLAHANEGANLTRVDAWLGVSYFNGMYGRSSDVFGAMPSLHCAFALIVAVEGWATYSTPWRALSAAFFALMCFGAVYLDHHWVLDVLAGIAYCLAVVGIARVLTRRRAAGATSPAAAFERDGAGSGIR
jgi:membrane-associated phospholipid phosphatase